MAKIKCTKHNRRVMVFSQSSVIHREDGSKCDGAFNEFPAFKAFTIGDSYVSLSAILNGATRLSEYK